MCLVIAWSASPASADDLYETAQKLRSEYAAELAGLATWCDEQGLAAEAQKTRSWLHARDPNKLYVAVLPKEVGYSELADDATPNVVEWHTRFMRLRREQAGALYDHARRAIRGNRASLAFDLVLAALRENADHEAIRRILGYQAYRGEWRTAYEVRRLRNKQVWHEKFGWLPASYVRRYEAGQRVLNGRWISAEEDAALRRDINHGWDIETEHYTVRTNHSIEAGVELCRQLERLYGVWKQLFAPYYLSEAQVMALFAGSARSPAARSQRHHVVYFRDQDDYIRSLKPALPEIEISVGVYVDGTRRAYFFHGDDDQRNLVHEATHQLFHESRPVGPEVGRHHNFWIIEGIAMYMESLRAEDGYHVLGGFDDLRMQAARYRLLEDNFYVPLAQFSGFGMEDVLHHERIATLYSQAAGLAQFLVHYDGGRYRDALVAYLSAVYSGRDNPNTLAQLTGTSYAELDRQYRQFMEQGPRQP
jgi:hypothetical protein